MCTAEFIGLGRKELSCPAVFDSRMAKIHKQKCLTVKQTTPATYHHSLWYLSREISYLIQPVYADASFKFVLFAVMNVDSAVFLLPILEGETTVVGTTQSTLGRGLIPKGETRRFPRAIDISCSWCDRRRKTTTTSSATFDGVRRDRHTNAYPVYSRKGRSCCRGHWRGP